MTAAAMGARVGPGTRPALVIVDMTLGFTDPGSPVGAEVDAAVEATAVLLERARAGGVPVVFTTIAFAPADLEAARAFLAKGPGMHALKVGSLLAEVDPRLAPRPDEPVLRKLFPSAFFGTPLAASLASRQCDTVLLAGVSTSGCVRASAVDAVSHGYRVIVPREAVGDRDPDAHEASLRDIDRKYGDVVGFDEALACLPAGDRAGEPGTARGAAA